MDWAHKRRLMVILILAAVVLSIVVIAAFAIFYQVPTCTDLKQNQDETGIDCGGSCSTLCSAEVAPATVRFVRPLVQSGRTDVIAYIDNPNREAYAKNASMTLESYAANGGVVRTHLEVDLGPGTTVPVFIPGVLSAGSGIRQAFLTFDEGSPTWTKVSAQEGASPTVSNIVTESPDTSPRITATLVNQTARPIYNTTLTATVFDASGTAIAASQTLVPTLPAQGTAPLVFTWNEPFAAPVVRVDIVPKATSPRIRP